MGAKISTPKDLEKCSKHDVATYVSAIGDKYEGYANAIIADGKIDGKFLAKADDKTFEKTLDRLNVTTKLHRRKLERSLAKMLKPSASIPKSGSSASLLSLDSTLSLEADSYASSSRLSIGSLDGSDDGNQDGEKRRPRRSRSSRTSDVCVNKVMKNAMVAKHVDDIMPGKEDVFVPAVLQAALDAQVKEKESLQQDLVELEFDREAMDSPPEGTVAIVLTDIEGSTALWESNPEAMKSALTIHDDIQRKLRAKHFGYEMDTEGDAFFLAFADAGDAFAFALELQLKLYEAEWSKEILATPWGADNGERRGLKVRISIHMGPVDTLENPLTHRLVYYGDGYDIAEEIENFTRGGQILTTAETWNAAFHLADIKLKSPKVKEYSKTLRLENDEDNVDSDSAGSNGSATVKRLIELTPAYMKELTDETRVKTKAEKKRLKLAAALSSIARAASMGEIKNIKSSSLLNLKNSSRLVQQQTSQGHAATYSLANANWRMARESPAQVTPRYPNEFGRASVKAL